MSIHGGGGDSLKIALDVMGRLRRISHSGYHRPLGTERLTTLRCVGHGSITAYL